MVILTDDYSGQAVAATCLLTQPDQRLLRWDLQYGSCFNTFKLERHQCPLICKPFCKHAHTLVD